MSTELVSEGRPDLVYTDDKGLKEAAAAADGDECVEEEETLQPAPRTVSGQVAEVTGLDLDLLQTL